MRDDKSVRYKLARQLGMLTVIPVLLAIAPLIGYFMGRQADRWLGTDPFLMLIGLGLGFVAGVRETILILKKASAEVDGNGPQSD